MVPLHYKFCLKSSIDFMVPFSVMKRRCSLRVYMASLQAIAIAKRVIEDSTTQNALSLVLLVKAVHFPFDA